MVERGNLQRTLRVLPGNVSLSHIDPSEDPFIYTCLLAQSLYILDRLPICFLPCLKGRQLLLYVTRSIK